MVQVDSVLSGIDGVTSDRASIGLSNMFKEETELNYDEENICGLNELSDSMHLMIQKVESFSDTSTVTGHSESPQSSAGSSPNISAASATHQHIEKRHICEICGKGFPYLSILESHKRCHTGEKPFSCHFCDKKFAQKATLQVHERTHTGERPYKCRYCDKTFAQYGTKTVHEKSAHLGIRNYKCPKCSKFLSSPSALYTHKKTHGEKTFFCEFCPKTFTLKNYLKLHVKQVHEQNERKHICPYCKKSFAYAGSLQVHVRTHTGERPFTCRFCPKAFASQGNLQSHERTHTGERPYSCTQCDRSFIQKSQLTAHEATHQYQPGISIPEIVPEQPSPDSMTKKQSDYICKYCGKRYAYASSLYVHTRLHTGERPFRCSFCDKSFTNQGNMQVHQRVHTGEKPFKCAACEKSYAQKVGLKIHLEQCPQYQSIEGGLSPGDVEKPNSFDCLFPKLLNLQDSGVPLMPMQHPGQPMQAPIAQERTSPSSIGLKVSAIPPNMSFNSPSLVTKCFVDYAPGSGDSTPSPHLTPFQNTMSPPRPNAAQAPDISPSAFHGVSVDTYKNPSFVDSNFDSQLVSLKRILDGTLSSSLVPPQLLLQNQQLQMLLQSQGQWCGLIGSQQMASPLYPQMPSLQSLVNLLPQMSHPPTVIQSGFVSSTIKNESAMLV